MNYVIRLTSLSPPAFVAGFSELHQVVVLSSREGAKLFPTLDLAATFLREYGDAGYGLQSGEASIEEFEAGG